MKGLLIQEFKTLFKSPASFSILIIPLVLLIGLGYLIPSGWIIPSSITIGIVGTVLLYFGGSIEEIKRTSFMKSISLTRLNKFTFLATKILFSVFISLISVLWVLFFGYMFSEVFEFLATDFSHLIPSTTEGVMGIVSGISFKVNWQKIHWFVMLYAGSITIIVSISIAFIFVTFSKSSLSFYLMSFGYLLGMILFGGVVMPSFLISSENSWFKDFYYIIPNFYTNNVMATSFGNGLGPTILNVSDILTVVNDSIFPAFNAVPTADETELVTSFLNSWNFNDAKSLEDAYNAMGGATGASDYITEVYNLLNRPFADENINYGGIGLNAWDDYLLTHIKDFLEYNVVLISNLLNNFGLNISSDFLLNLLQTPNLIMAEVINSIFELNNIVVFEVLRGGYIHEFIISLTEIVNNMFNTAKPLDYYVPWIETVGFLSISIMFFKWS